LEGFKVEFVKHDIPTEMMRDYCHDQDVSSRSQAAMVVFDGLRTPLPRDLNPGESITSKAAILRLKRPETNAPRNDGSGSTRMVFRQRLGLCLNIGFVK
jgi:hypothetical protein